MSLLTTRVEKRGSVDIRFSERNAELGVRWPAWREKWRQEGTLKPWRAHISHISSTASGRQGFSWRLSRRANRPKVRRAAPTARPVGQRL